MVTLKAGHVIELYGREWLVLCAAGARDDEVVDSSDARKGWVGFSS